jgi:uridylate kinase
MKKKPYKRIFLKLSGEIFGGNRGYGIDPDVLSQICNKIIKIKQAGIEIGIVIGGGNIFRGISAAAKGMDRVVGDYFGMMATIMNSVGVESGLEELNCDTRVMSGLSITQLAEPYIRRRATRYLEKNRIVIMAGGTGNLYFITDTGAVLRAIEIDADVVIKATKVDGIYSDDPVANPDAIKYPEITFKEVIDKELKVMDMTGVTLCKENKLPIIVFNINEDENIVNLIDNKHIGTLVS